MLLLTACLLSACAASDPLTPNGGREADQAPLGAFSAYLTGRVALSSADYERAADALLVALAANPDSVDLRHQAFTAALIAGHPSAGALARGIPDNPIAQLLLGNIDAKAGRWRMAERRFADLPHQGPMQIVQPILLAWVRQGDGRTDEALSTLREALETQPARGLLSLHAALIADLADRGRDAESFYQIAATDPSGMNVRLAYLLAAWHVRTGHPETAQRLLNQIQEAVPDAGILTPGLTEALGRRPVNSPTDGLAEVFLALGSSLRSANTNDLALMILGLALELRPDFSAARLAMSDIHVTRQHTDAALAVLAPVRDRDVLAPLVRLRRSALQDRLGRTNEAIAILRDLASDVPGSPVPDRHLGDIYRSKSRFSEAITAYDRAITRIPTPAPSDWIVFYHRGVALERDGQWSRAEADFEHALRLAPDQPYALNYLAYSWTERGQNLDRARAMLERALRSRPNDGAITDSLGWVMFRMGNLQDAVRLLERAIELEPDDPTISSHLGDAYWAVGRRIEALYQWRRALTLNPPPREAAQLEQKTRPDYAGPVATSH